jgi:hypothetical protein
MYETNQSIRWDVDHWRGQLIDTAPEMMKLRTTCPAERLTVYFYEKFASFILMFGDES